MDISEQIMWLITHKCGGNVSEMARKLDVTEGTVRNWKNGQEVKESTRKKIADVFEVSEDWLLFGDRSEVQSLALGRADDKVIYIHRS